MLKTQTLTLLAILTAMILLAPGAQSAGTCTVAMADNGNTVTIEQGSALEVKLSKPSAPGFAWDILQNDATLLALEKREIVKNPNPFNNKSIEIFTFRATRSGATTLKLYLHRTGETGALPGGNFAVTVNVPSTTASSSASTLSSPSPSPSPTASPATVTTLMEANSGGVYIIGSGSTLEVRLEYSAGTGFIWEIAENNGGVLPLVRTADETVANIPGGKQVRVFTFNAKTPGTSTLRIHYMRPWERLLPPAKVFIVAITVR